MNALDWVCLAIVLILALRCLVRGFVAEILSVASWIVGAAVALLLYRQAGAFLHGRFANLPLPEAVAFAAIFVLAFLLTRLLGHMLREGLEAANLATLDKVLGFFLGLFEGLVSVSLILLVMQALGDFLGIAKILEGSFFARTILPVIGPEVAKAISPAGQNGGKLPTLKVPEVKIGPITPGIGPKK